MRAIHVVPAITEEASGPSYAVVRLCESLIAEGNEVELAVLDWGAMPLAPNFLKTFRPGLGPRRLGRSAAMRQWLTAMASSKKVDLIHNHSLWMMPNVYSGQVSTRHDIPLVVSPHGTLAKWAMRSGSRMKLLAWPLLQRPAIASAACFHATANSEYADIRRMGFRQPVAVIPNGIDIPSLTAKVKTHSRTLLFLGRIHPIKGLDMLLPAWQAVQDRYPEWRLVIAGPDNGGYLAEMQRMAADLRLKRIEFSGKLIGHQKWLAYGRADLFVLPTYSENFGMTVAEGLAAGTPVIVTKGAPWGDLARHGSGWWIDIGIDPLVACLEEALAQPSSELEEMGLRGREWMATEYTWTRLGEQMAETYRWMLTGGGKPEWVTEA